jgi:dipeptidyl aminopeptidase/acylaminoacyl peptidase
MPFTGSFFTEKYFGYQRMIGHSLHEADLSLHAASFISKNYLLIHGTADTLVHQQHTMLLTKSLIQKGVIFRHQVRPMTHNNIS